MADKKLSAGTARTAEQMQALDELASIISGGTNSRITAAELQRVINQKVREKPANEPFFFLFFGQSWLKNATTPTDTGTIAQNPNVSSWQSDGVGNYSWLSPDLTDTILADAGGNPYTGVGLGNYSYIAWKFSDLWQKATGVDTYFLNVAYSGASISLFGSFGASATAMDEMKTQMAAAIADSVFTTANAPSKPDLTVFALGYTDAGSTLGSDWAEDAMNLKRDMESATVHNLTDPEKPFIVMDMPRTAYTESTQAAWAGARLLSEFGGPNLNLLDNDNIPTYDGAHLDGDRCNIVSANLFSLYAGLIPSKTPDAAIRVVRDTAVLSEGYLLAADSAGAPTLTTGQLNFNTTDTALRLMVTSDDANTIPWQNIEQWTIIRISETADALNFRDFRLSAGASWDALTPSDPNHAQFLGTVYDDTSWTRPADGTALTLSLYLVSPLGGLTETPYYTGLTGVAEVAEALRLKSYAITRNATSLRVENGNRGFIFNPEAELVVEDGYQSVKTAQTTSATIDVSAAYIIPNDSRWRWDCVVTGHRTDSDSSAMYYLNESAICAKNSGVQTIETVTLGESTTSAMTGISLADFLSVSYTVSIEARASEDWDFRIESTWTRLD